MLLQFFFRMPLEESRVLLPIVPMRLGHFIHLSGLLLLGEFEIVIKLEERQEHRGAGVLITGAQLPGMDDQARIARRMGDAGRFHDDPSSA
jgi:hypothetical protein